MRIASPGWPACAGVPVGDSLEFRFDAVFDEKDVRWLNQVREMLEALVTDEVFKRQTLRESSLQMKRMCVLGDRSTGAGGRARAADVPGPIRATWTTAALSRLDGMPECSS